MNVRAMVVAVAFAAGLLAGCATPQPVSPADSHLSAPASEVEREYLGLSKGATNFVLEEIRCDVLVIDCFDMYCHICQNGAKHVNELHRLVEEHGLSSRVKFIGLGMGDTPLETATYKEKFKVPFPVFPDRRSAVARQFGPVRVPNLLILRRRDGELRLVNSSPGVLLNLPQVLSHIENALQQDSSYHWNDRTQAAQPTCRAGSDACRRPAAAGRNLPGNGVRGQ